MYHVDNLSLSVDASKLWYSHEETDLFKAWLSHQVEKVRSQIEEHSELLDEELVTVDAAAILGLEKYLSSELTAEYKIRRRALKRAVLEEYRWQSAVKIPHTSRLAKISAENSRWARERARAAALFLDQDVMQDLAEMTCPPPPRRDSMPCLQEETNLREETDLLKVTKDEESSYKRQVTFVPSRWRNAYNTTAKIHCCSTIPSF